MKGLFDLSSAEGKAKLNQFLEDAKPFLDDPASALADGGGSVPIPDYAGFSRLPTSQTLAENTILDRYGSPSGSYLSPARNPPWARALPPNATQNELKRYKVKQPLTVNSGWSAPWYGQPGGGIQYQLQNDLKIQDLLTAEILEEIP